VASEPVPLKTADDGVIRVGNSRVTLDTVVEAFLQGASPEAIAEQYPSVALADVYYAISFYLRRRAEVDDYLRERQRARAEIQADNETKFPPDGIRAKLLARQKAE
jgi:uncharacterized protein (DUF433 family)